MLATWSFWGDRFHGYHEISDSPLDPSEIVKNPYLYKGRSGRIEVSPSFAPMTFERMVGENLAAYEIAGTGGFSVSMIVVQLDDNVPPLVTRPWHVYVEDPEDLTNGFGATIRSAAIKFQGYADLPVVAPSVQVTPGLLTPAQTEPTQAVPIETQSPAVPDPVAGSAKPTEEETEPSQPAPIERQVPAKSDSTGMYPKPIEGNNTDSPPSR